MKKHALSILPAAMLLLLLSGHAAQQRKIYWGSEVPAAWNGDWPEKFRTGAEKSGFTTTASHQEILDYMSLLQGNSEHVYVYNMFVSDLRRNCPVIVMANPRITSPQQAQASGKTVVYLQGGIHPGECEGKEALLMLMRDILVGKKKYLLDKLIILCCPNFNVDGAESWSLGDGFPRLAGIRENAQGYDVNRDAIKVQTVNMQGAYRNLFNTWDPVIIHDTHRMGGARHGYAIVYAASNVATAHPEPRGYVTNQIFPAVRQAARDNGGLEIFFHAGVDSGWPPKEFTHDNAIWSTEGKFMVSGYGLRNRMSILVETPGWESFEKKIYSQYVFARELLEYTFRHGEEMQLICRRAEEDVIDRIRTQAESGKLKNFVEGKYESYGKVEVYAYPAIPSQFIAGTSIRQNIIERLAPQLCPGVELITKPVGTKEATVPRGYLIPSDMGYIVEKLRIHNIRVNVLDKPVVVSGEEFVIDKLAPVSKGGYNMTELQGGFFRSERREFPAGTFQVDMAQPLANMAFYCLEPQVGDGFAGWNQLNEYLEALGVKKHSVVYPIFKYLRVLE
jgi:dipeptidyl-peptidase-4